MKCFLYCAGLFLLITPAAWSGLTPEQIRQLPSPATHTIDFNTEVKPLFEASCIKCHGRGKDKGGLRLDTRETFLHGGDSGPSIVVGKSAESYLVELIAAVDPDNVMPQKGSRLTPEQVGIVRAWIDQGAVWDSQVTFAKPPPLNLLPRKVALPQSDATVDLASPIDQLLQAYLQSNHVQWDQIVPDPIFVRRVYLDTIGLLPTPDELDRFVAEQNPDKRGRLIGQLLADNQRYAEHWLSFWNDALRNDYKGTGYIDDGRKQISSWLFSALSGNQPYDRFVRELIDPSPESEGFINGIVWRGTVNASQTPPMQAAQNISQVFLGVNLKCASCHDSFINDWTLADAYRLASVYADKPLQMYHCDKPTGQTVSAGFIYPQVGAIEPGLTKEKRRTQLAALLTSPQNARLARTIVNRFWAKFFGRGLVPTLDDMEQPAWHQDLLDWLAQDLVEHKYDLKHTIELILTSRAYQLPAVEYQENAPYVFAGPAVRRMSAEQFCDSLASVAGTWQNLPASEFDFTSGLSAGEIAALMPQPSQWIWTQTNAVRKARPETVYWRREVNFLERPHQALAVIGCDNSFTLYVNGEKATSGKDPKKAKYVDLRPHLKPGRNVIAVAVVNAASPKPPAKPKKSVVEASAAAVPAAEVVKPVAPADTVSDQPKAKPAPPEGAAPTPPSPPAVETADSSEPEKVDPEADWNPAGLFFYARVRQAGLVHDFASDGEWQWSTNKFEDWAKPQFTPTNWTAAVELGAVGIAPWNLGDAIPRALSVVQVMGRVRSALVNADPLTSALGRPPREQVVTARPGAATTLQALELTNGETLNRILQESAKRLRVPATRNSSEFVEALYRKTLGRAPTTEERESVLQFLGPSPEQAGIEDLLWSLTMLPEFQLIY